MNPPASLAKQIVQRRLGAGHFGRIFGDVGTLLWLEEIAEIRLVLLAHFLRGRLLAMLGVADVVLDAEFADVEFGIACLAHIESALAPA